MPKLKINDMEIEVEAGTSVLQACEQLGVEIPRFCYHDKLTVPANCRMCLVELKGAPKPIASCAMAAGDNMEIFTNSERTQKARHGVLEFMLANHPLDCPICDQGGECDLQDEAFAYGFDRGRYKEDKRAVTDKDFGPLISTTMTRCIHCTRCVRFAEEIAGVPELGQVFRGEHAEITTFTGGPVTSELSGNMVDICPVGALTSKPYAFKARAWELKKTESIDVMDAVGSNIRIDARGAEVMRILPAQNDEINEEWISDKTRYSYDGLLKSRLDKPYIKCDGKLVEATWDEAFEVIADKMAVTDSDKIAAITGDQCDAESMKALLDLMEAHDVESLECRQDGALFDTNSRVGYLFNTGIAAIEEADYILIVGANPRYEATMINARIRKSYLQGGVKIGLIGTPSDLTYPYKYLGAGAKSLSEIANGKHEICMALTNAKKPMIIAGSDVFLRDDAAAIQALLHKITDKYLNRSGWNGYNMLHKAAARVAALDMGFVPKGKGRNMAEILEGAETGAVEFIYLLGADEFDVSKIEKTFVVYQGHHGDKGAHVADVILPAAAFTEKNGLYVNLEGRVQMGRKAVFPVGDAREDWAIIRALSAKTKHQLPYDTLMEVRAALTKDVPSFGNIGTKPTAAWQKFGIEGELNTAQPFTFSVDYYYRDSPLGRASKTMQALYGEIWPYAMQRNKIRTGTDG